MVAARFYPALGGLEGQARLLGKTLVARQQVTAITVLTRRFGGWAPRETLDGMEVVRLPWGDKNRWLASASYISAALARARFSGFDLLHCFQSYSPATIGSLCSLLGGPPAIVKITASNEYGEVRELGRLPFAGLRQRLLRHIARFVIVNRTMQTELESIGIPAAKIRYIPNGTLIPELGDDREAVRAQAKAELGIPFGQALVFTGRLSEEKRLDVALDALARLLPRYPDLGLVLVGDDGGYRGVEAQLRAMAKERGLVERVLFTGRVPNVAPYLRAADLFVLLSVSEGLSNALLEAMAYSCPVVATDIPANQDVFDDGQEGLKVPVGDVAATAAAIELLASDPRLRRSFGERARHRATEKFSIDAVAWQHEELYREVIDEA